MQLLVFMLLNSSHEQMSELDGKQATVTFKRDEGIAFRKTLTVSESKIQFTIDQALAVGTYDVEVTCEGYVFPSKPTVTIEVTQSHANYSDVAPLEQVPTVEQVRELIDNAGVDESAVREIVAQELANFSRAVSMTSSEYEALETKDSNTFYIIKKENRT